MQNWNYKVTGDYLSHCFLLFRHFRHFRSKSDGRPTRCFATSSALVIIIIIRVFRLQRKTLLLFYCFFFTFIIILAFSSYNFCAEDFSEMARPIYLKFSEKMYLYLNLIRFFHFFENHFRSRVIALKSKFWGPLCLR